MEKVDLKHWQHKGYDIFKEVHPALFGKYEIYEGEQFIDRVMKKKHAVEIIDERETKRQQIKEACKVWLNKKA